MKPWRTPLDVDKQKTPHGKIYIIVDRCKGCGFCVEYCPRNVLEMSEDFNQKGYHPPHAPREADCVDCDLCELICPEFAIFVLKDEESESEDQIRQKVDESIDQSEQQQSDDKKKDDT
jgi:2-oxoglutarate ferredoxin oxidoreductase subunit delta